MPQLRSGRHVGLSKDRLIEWAHSREHMGPLLFFYCYVRSTDELWGSIDVVLFEAASDPTSPGAMPSGPYLAGYTVAEISGDKCDWNETEKAEFMEEFIKEDRVCKWLAETQTEVEEILKSKPLPESLRGILD